MLYYKMCKGKGHFVQCIIAVTDIFLKKIRYSFKIITYNPELTEKEGGWGEEKNLLLTL